MSRPRDTLTERATRIAVPPCARDERCVGQHRDTDHILEKTGLDLVRRRAIVTLA
jgi:hypothetical protein